MIEIIDATVYRGRNIHSHKPTMKITVDIGKFSEIPTKDVKGFNEKLLMKFPNLRYNTCGLGYEGGFVVRLNEGTYIAHVLEHVILDIQNTLGFDVKYGKTRLLKEPSQYYLVFEFINEVCALECSRAAVYILNYFLKGKDLEVEEFLEYLRKIVIDTELGPSTAAIVNEAKKRNIPITRIGNESLVRLGHGKNSKLIQSTMTDQTSCISADISCNKQLTKQILDDCNIPVPYGKVVYSENSAVNAANKIGMPVVVKPFNGNQGKGVHINITNKKDVISAFREASKYSAGVIVEAYTRGEDYRILVIGGEVKAVAKRLPAMVTGDGIHTISELVDLINIDPLRGNCHEKALTKIKIGKVEKSVLKKRGIDENYTPFLGEIITLRENGNISTGGTAIDCTDIIHPDNAEIAIRAANAIGIDIAGIDMVAEDISKSIRKSSGAVIEVNTAPGIRMHLFPSEGQPRNVAKDIVDILFPEESTIDFPIVSVTGTNGKTTTVRLISHVLSQTGKTVGMTSTSGTFIGEKCISKGDHSGPRSAKSLLANKMIDCAVFETARGGILREGLGYDLANVAVVTNITDDHLGIDGIDTLEDLAFVKSLVPEAVKPNGFVVLNAEDEMTNYILTRVKATPILFYKKKENVKVGNFNDYITVFVDNGTIKIKNKQNEATVVQTEQIPITNKGILECNIDNSLAAIGALYALKVPIQIIANGLMSFKNNPGRFEIFEVNGIKVILDYAHNQAGYEQIDKLIKNLTYKRCIGIIGMPGDRLDSDIQSVGKIASNIFSEIYIKEDTDLRGRKECEVINLLQNSIIEAGFEKDNITIISNEVEALKNAIDNAQEGDLIVVLYECLEPLKDVINSYIML